MTIYEWLKENNIRLIITGRPDLESYEVTPPDLMISSEGEEYYPRFTDFSPDEAILTFFRCLEGLPWFRPGTLQEPENVMPEGLTIDPENPYEERPIPVNLQGRAYSKAQAQ